MCKQLKNLLAEKAELGSHSCATDKDAFELTCMYVSAYLHLKDLRNDREA